MQMSDRDEEFVRGPKKMDGSSHQEGFRFVSEKMEITSRSICKSARTISHYLRMEDEAPYESECDSLNSKVQCLFHPPPCLNDTVLPQIQ